MNRPRWIQAQATLLLAVFLAAGTSLPSLDAIFFHTSPEERQSWSHIEAAGECVTHSGSCTLARTAPGSGAGILAAAQPKVVAPSLPPASVLVTQHRSDSHRITQARPRAPPASLS
jgi:hypothetical protein